MATTPLVSGIVGAWRFNHIVEAPAQTLGLFTNFGRRKLSISCSSRGSSEAGGSSKPRRRKKNTESPGGNGAEKQASGEQTEKKKVTRAKRKETGEKKAGRSKKKDEDDAENEAGDETDVIEGTDEEETDLSEEGSDAESSVKKKSTRKRTSKKVMREGDESSEDDRVGEVRKSVRKSRGKKATPPVKLVSDEQKEEEEQEDTDAIEDASDAESLRKKTVRARARKKVAKASKPAEDSTPVSSEDDRRDEARKSVRKSRKKKAPAAEEGEEDPSGGNKIIKKAPTKPRRSVAQASEASEEAKQFADAGVEAGESKEPSETSEQKKVKRKAARKATKETESVKTPITEEEEESLYEKEGRWQLMEEERRRLNQRYLEKLASSDEEDEEVYSEDDDDEEEEEEEEKEASDHIVDMKFPEKECYALMESYKPRKIGKDEKPPLKNEELWWNHRTLDFSKEHYWSENQKRQGLPDITLAAMTAMTGRIKLFGDVPSVTETHIYRARKDVFYEERLRAEEKRRKEIGPMAYYQEWVKAWDKDTSKEAVQKHYEETGEDVAMQLMNMLACQTKPEFNHMMGTDPRIRRDPLVMRATKEMKRSVFGGDPVYPTINYIKKPGAAPDFRGPNFHEPSPSIIERLLRSGIMKTREEHNKIMAAQMERLAKLEEEASDEESDEEMVAAIDIGEDEEDEDVDEAAADDEDLPFKDDDVVIVPTDDLLQIPEEED